MIDDLTPSWYSTGSRTRVSTLEIHASFVQWTVTVNYTFRSTSWWVSYVTRGTRTHCLSTDVLTPTIRTTGWRVARLYYLWVCKTKGWIFKAKYNFPWLDSYFRILCVSECLSWQRPRFNDFEDVRHVSAFFSTNFITNHIQVQCYWSLSCYNNLPFTGKHAVNAFPDMPSGQLHMGVWFITTHSAFCPQTPVQGSKHLLRLQALSRGQSGFWTHSGRHP